MREKLSACIFFILRNLKVSSFLCHAHETKSAQERFLTRWKKEGPISLQVIDIPVSTQTQRHHNRIYRHAKRTRRKHSTGCEYALFASQTMLRCVKVYPPPPSPILRVYAFEKYWNHPSDLGLMRLRVRESNLSDIVGRLGSQLWFQL